MTEEGEALYMDIYDNGLVSNEYKEKFKHLINTEYGELQDKNFNLKKQIWTKEKCLARLKREYEKRLRKASKARHSLITKKNEYKDQLEQAKEIIKEYVNWDYGDKSICLPDITKQAEQFLKETDNDRKAD